MNLHGIVAGAVATVNPRVIGSIQTSTGDVAQGDAQFTASMAAGVLTVSAVASGNLAPGSVILGQNASVIEQLTGPTGGTGTYSITSALTAASAALQCTGDGTRIPSYSTTAGVEMQVQALCGREVEHLDSLNITGIMRGVYLYGDIQSLVRVAGRGGDLLLIPTGYSGQAFDTWSVEQVLETWADAAAGGWCKVAAKLQNPPLDQ